MDPEFVQIVIAHLGKRARRILGYCFLLVLGWSMICGNVNAQGNKANRQPVRLRVLTYNIHHGEGTDQKLDLDRIARVIRQSQADLVALQELDQNTERTRKVDQIAELGRLTGLRTCFGKAMDYQGGGYGVAILSRWSLLETNLWRLPGSPGREPRVALEVKVSAGHQDAPQLWFVSTHLDHASEPERIRQVEFLNEKLVPPNGEPKILAGDLNATPESKPMRIIFQEWTGGEALNTTPTSPAGNPRARIDYILFRPAHRWQEVESIVLNEPVASDHRPVLSILELGSPER